MIIKKGDKIIISPYPLDADGKFWTTKQTVTVQRIRTLNGRDWIEYYDNNQAFRAVDVKYCKLWSKK